MSQEKNICRPITFINDYMPIRSKTKGSVEFCAFGIVDGIKVDEAFVFDGSESTITDWIWESQKAFSIGLEGKYSVQRIYAVRWEKEEVERAFWEGDALPFFFFCRVQYDNKKAFYLNKRRELEKCLQGEKLQAMTYLTYDNTDLFIVLRASEFSVGAAAINRLHKKSILLGDKCILKNSFTVMAVRYSWINRVTASEKDKWNQQVIENVYIRLIERNCGSIEKIEKEIRSGIQNVHCYRRAVLGTDDEMIVLSDVGWGDFLSLYNEESGVFGNRFEADSVYNQNAAGVTTQLSVPLEDEEGDCIVKPQNNYVNAVYNRRIENLRKKLDRLNKSAYNMNELNIILNALPKYSGEMFNDYVFFPLLKVIDTLLDLMLKRLELCDGRLDKLPFYDFLQGFCFYTQHTMLTDRYTAQTMGFNTKIYDIPVKLNALYNALLYRLVSILKKQKPDQESGEAAIDYNFIALPGVADFVNVIELYKDVSDTKRLMKVEIPENSFYDVRSMMVILSHETAHYVGREMRNRDTRTDAVVQSFVHVYVQYIQKAGLLGACYDSEVLWAENEARLTNLIYRTVCEKLEERKARLKERYKNDIDYFMKLIPQIYTIMIEIISSNLSTVFAPLLWEEKNDVLKRQLLDKIQRISWRFTVVSSMNDTTNISSRGILNALMKLYEESFADLMSILILQMSPEEYISGIVESAKYQGMDIEILKQSEACLRISSVLGCILGFDIAEKGRLLKKKFQFDSRMREAWWKDMTGLDDVGYVNMLPWQKMAQKALWLWVRQRQEPEYRNEKYKDNVYCAIEYDNRVLGYVTEYLNSCMDKFVDSSKGVQFEKTVQSIRNLFQCFMKREGASGEDQIKEVVHFIEDYRRDLLFDATEEGNVNGIRNNQ